MSHDGSVASLPPIDRSSPRPVGGLDLAVVAATSGSLYAVATTKSPDAAAAIMKRGVGKMKINKFIKSANRIKHLAMLTRSLKSHIKGRGEMSGGSARALTEHNYPLNSLAEIAHMYMLTDAAGKRCLEWYFILKEDMGWQDEGQHAAEIDEIKEMSKVIALRQGDRKDREEAERRRLGQRGWKNLKDGVHSEHHEDPGLVSVVGDEETRAEEEENKRRRRKLAGKRWRVATIAVVTANHFNAMGARIKQHEKELFEVLTAIERYDAQCDMIRHLAHALANSHTSLKSTVTMANGEEISLDDKHSLGSRVKQRKKLCAELAEPIRGCLENARHQVERIKSHQTKVTASLTKLAETNETEGLQAIMREIEEEADSEDEPEPEDETGRASPRRSPGSPRHRSPTHHKLRNDRDKLNVDGLHKDMHGDEEHDSEHDDHDDSRMQLEREKAKEELRDAFYTFKENFNVDPTAKSTIGRELVDMALGLQQELESGGETYHQLAGLRDIQARSRTDREHQLSDLATNAAINLKRKAARKQQMKKSLEENHKRAVDLLKKARKYLKAELSQIKRDHEASVKLAQAMQSKSPKSAMSAADSTWSDPGSARKRADSVSASDCQAIMHNGKVRTLEGISPIIELLEARLNQVLAQPAKEEEAKKMLKRIKHSSKTIVKSRYELKAWNHRLQELQNSESLTTDDPIWNWSVASGELYNTQLDADELLDDDEEEFTTEAIQIRLQKVDERIKKKDALIIDARRVLHTDLSDDVPEVIVEACYEVPDEEAASQNVADAEERHVKAEMMQLEREAAKAQREMQKIEQRRMRLITASNSERTGSVVSTPRRDQVRSEIQAARELARAEASVEAHRAHVYDAHGGGSPRGSPRAN